MAGLAFVAGLGRPRESATEDVDIGYNIYGSGFFGTYGGFLGSGSASEFFRGSGCASDLFLGSGSGSEFFLNSGCASELFLGSGSGCEFFGSGSCGCYGSGGACA